MSLWETGLSLWEVGNFRAQPAKAIHSVATPSQCSAKISQKLDENTPQFPQPPIPQQDLQNGPDTDPKRRNTDPKRRNTDPKRRNIVSKRRNHLIEKRVFSRPIFHLLQLRGERSSCSGTCLFASNLSSSDSEASGVMERQCGRKATQVVHGKAVGRKSNASR
jgi:hypothetical protein